MKKDKRTNNHLQKHTHKTKYRVTGTSLKIGGELRSSERVSSSCSTSGTRRVTLVTNPVISHALMLNLTMYINILLCILLKRYNIWSLSPSWCSIEVSKVGYCMLVTFLSNTTKATRHRHTWKSRGTVIHVKQTIRIWCCS
jgi:hypothetical protein